MFCYKHHYFWHRQSSYAFLEIRRFGNCLRYHTAWEEVFYSDSLDRVKFDCGLLGCEDMWTCRWERIYLRRTSHNITSQKIKSTPSPPQGTQISYGVKVLPILSYMLYLGRHFPFLAWPRCTSQWLLPTVICPITILYELQVTAKQNLNTFSQFSFLK
jgi:hypothetical protein